MTWLGKILTIVVFLVALVWVWFTVTVFVTRTNWRTHATNASTALKASEDARQKEYAVYQAENDALRRQLAAEQEKTRGLTSQVDTLAKANQDNNTQVKGLTEAIAASDIKTVELQNNLKATTDELDKVRARNTTLEDERVRLVIAKETAEKQRQAAENDAKLARTREEDANKRVEEVTAKYNELRETGGRPGGAPERAVNPPPPATPEGTRGTVEKFEGDHIEINIGIDAGVRMGAVLDVYRYGEKARYLGTLTITRVEPKKAVGVFKPVSGKPLNRLLPEELPRKDDEVGRLDRRIDVGTTGRP